TDKSTLGSFGTGRFLQTAGTATFSGGLTVGGGSVAVGTVSLSNTGVISTTGAEVYGALNDGTLIESGGTHVTTGSVVFGANSTSAFGRGSLTGGTWSITSDLTLGSIGVASISDGGTSVSVGGN